jgi:hypothetical protein
MGWRCVGGAPVPRQGRCGQQAQHEPSVHARSLRAMWVVVASPYCRLSDGEMAELDAASSKVKPGLQFPVVSSGGGRLAGAEACPCSCTPYGWVPSVFRRRTGKLRSRAGCQRRARLGREGGESGALLAGEQGRRLQDGNEAAQSPVMRKTCGERRMRCARAVTGERCKHQSAAGALLQGGGKGAWYRREDEHTARCRPEIPHGSRQSLISISYQTVYGAQHRADTPDSLLLQRLVPSPHGRVQRLALPAACGTRHCRCRPGFLCRLGLPHLQIPADCA